MPTSSRTVRRSSRSTSTNSRCRVRKKFSVRSSHEITWSSVVPVTGKTASLAALLASRLDLLQGTCEKIHLQDLLGQHPLESADLFPERRLSRMRWRSFAALHRLQLLAPPIQQPSTDAEFLREFHNVLAVVQPVHGHLPKGLL